MSKDPAFLFYTSDFLTGIADLDMEERGQYISLLCLQHQKGHLTAKMIRLCVGNAAADVMAKFRQDSAGLWYNPRLDLEIEKRAEHSEKQRQRALEGWEKRREKKQNQTDATANATALPLENEDVNENDIENRVKEKGLGKTIREDQTEEVFQALQVHFQISEIKNFSIFRELDSFCMILQSKKQIPEFIEQFPAYVKYKELAQEKSHNFKGFIGTIENHYQDGGWCADNWKHKLENFKPNATGNKQSAVEKREQDSKNRREELARSFEERSRRENGGTGV